MTSMMDASIANIDKLKKCGEITRTQKEFLLVCTFCGEVFLNLGDFINHIDEQHYDDVYEEICVSENQSDEDAEDITHFCTTEESETNADVIWDVKEEQPMEFETCGSFGSEESDDELEEPFMNTFNNDSGRKRNQTKVKREFNVSENVKIANNHDLLKDKDDLSLAIIAEYKEHPLLWNRKHSFNQHRAKRKEAFQQIVSNVNEQFNSTLNWKTVRLQIRKMLKRYGWELNKRRIAKLKGKPFVPSWYADQLKFLNPRYRGSDSNEILAMEHGENETDSDTLNDTEYARPHDLIKDEDDITVAVIAEYKNHPVLWSSDYPPNQNRAKREEAFQEVTNNVNIKFNAHLEWKNIREQIYRLRKRHYAELQNRKEAELKGKPLRPSWHAEQLKFLNSEMKYLSHKFQGANSCGEAQSELFTPKLNDSQNIKIINIYKSFPCLWDPQHMSYRFNNRRQEALAEVQEAVKDELGFSLTQVQLQNKISLMRETCSQEKKRKIECEHLEEPFEAICPYYDQIEFLEVNVAPFKCEVCEELINTYDQYLIHKSSHDGSMPFICSMCDKGFMEAGNLTVHMRRHTRDYQYECETCKKRFATSTELNVHFRQHTGEKPYFCEICGQSFRTWTFFDRHMRRHQNRVMYTCSICAKPFYGKNTLTEHMKAHLNVRDKVCNVCGKAFTSTANLRQHKQIHADKKKYVCRICEKDFAQYAGLSGHMKSHGTTLATSGFDTTIDNE